MHLAQCSGDADAQAQCAWQVGRSGAKDPVQRFAVGILEDEPRPPVLTGEGQRPHTPNLVQVRPRTTIRSQAGRSSPTRAVRDRLAYQDRPGITEPAAPLHQERRAFADRPEDVFGQVHHKRSHPAFMPHHTNLWLVIAWTLLAGQVFRHFPYSDE